MNIFKIIAFALLLVGCRSSTSSLNSSFDAKASELFFNADIWSKYDKLVKYFEDVNNLNEVETGWTIYPPLSALRQEENNVIQKTFEFKRYLGLASGFKNGIMTVRKISQAQDALAVLEINLEFNSKRAEEKFYKEVITDLNALQLQEEESTMENVRSTVFRDRNTSSTIKISELTVEEGQLYYVTIRLIPDKA
jgi:hypothetical protein